jgi:hypothetical protein
MTIEDLRIHSSLPHRQEFRTTNHFMRVAAAVPEHGGDGYTGSTSAFRR